MKISFVLANGNRYEGYFARGFKNGEGTFYHMHRGQIQKGIWQDDVCKTSMVQDEFRQQAQNPTQYPIPSVSESRQEGGDLKAFSQNGFMSC